MSDSVQSAKHTALAAAAKALARQHAEVCNVDFDDLWKLESESFYEDARKVLDAIGHDDLIAVLRALHDDIAEYLRFNNLGGFDNYWMRAARAAIAKATGSAA
jgi:hypothetical protein